LNNKLKCISLLFIFASVLSLGINLTDDNIVHAKKYSLNEFNKIKNVKDAYKYVDNGYKEIETCEYVSVATGKTKKKKDRVMGQFKRYAVYDIYDWETDKSYKIKQYAGYDWETIKCKIPVYKKKKVWHEIKKPYNYLIWKENLRGKEGYVLTSNNYYVSQKSIKNIPYQGEFVYNKYYKIKKVIKRYKTITYKYKKNTFWNGAKDINL
jgi:hypothetical protein